MFYFIKNMWVMNRITAEQVQGVIGKYLTQEQAEEIISLAQAK